MKSFDLRPGIVLSCALLANACAPVGPQYQRAIDALIDAPSARAGFVGAKESVFVPTELPDRWWRLYDDPVLDSLVEQAIAANADLRVAVANIAKSSAALEFADADREPSTSLTAAPGYGRRSAEEELMPGVLNNHFVYGMGAGVSYQLDLYGQISRGIDAARADTRAARAAYDVARVTVVAEVTRAYLDACAASRETEVILHSVEVQSRSRNLTDRLYGLGRATSLDSVRSAALEDDVRAKLPPLVARKQLALFRLATLSGRPPSELLKRASSCVREPKIEGPIPVGDGQALLKRRPDVRRAEDELQAATARIGLATSDLYPKISFGASVGSVGLSRDFLETSTLKFSIGPLISWQFPDRTRTRARIHAAEAEEQAAYARFDATVLKALLETESALAVYALDLDQRTLLEASRQKSSKAAMDSERLFSLGRSGYLTVLDANRVLIASEQAVAAADSKLSSDQVALFLALGGGWQGDIAPSSSP